MRKTGILMPLSSLPSKTGVGEMGSEAFHWIDLLKENGVKIWQLLPLNPVGYGNSPYQPYSSCAGDELYISLELLKEEGLLKELPVSFQENATSVDYDSVRSFKEPYLRQAFENFQMQGREKEETYQKFMEQDWVYEYGVFRALKAQNGGICWNEWKQDDKVWPETRTELSEDTNKEVQYQCFLQYCFYCQWMKLKEKANACGIEVMGDVPFYVGVDSVDVWSGKKNFLLDEDGHPTFIAGVPPDYFSATGQRWGNPIYDWDYLKENEYQFWVDRIGYSSKLFDIIRIDHFRAFDTFWKIPASCPTAIEGEWIEAPGYEVIDTLYAKLPQVNLVAEDLGDLRKEVLELKEHYHLKGMKIQIFSMETAGKYAYDLAENMENTIVYTGTHDNDTLMEWYQKLTLAKKRKVRRFLTKKGFKHGSLTDRMLAYIFKSKAEYAIIPMADILGQGKEGHINTPGTVGSPNWEWRMSSFEQAEKKLAKYKNLMTFRK